jgi:segregation and condensation protein A
MDAAGYRVRLELYEGPLDLLLYLVRRNEVDILDLPIAPITEQFQEFLSLLELIDLDTAGDFVVMASTLAEIKSRSILPSSDEGVDEADEPPIEHAGPRSELIQRLLEYRKFKDAAQALEERAALWQERYPRLSDERPLSGKDHAADRIREVELWDLISALGRVLRRKDVEEESRIRYDDTPIHVYVEQIGARVRAEGEVKFTSLFEAEALRSRIVGMFLAVLELLRHHGFRATQVELYGEITIYPPDGSASLVSGTH